MLRRGGGGGGAGTTTPSSQRGGSGGNRSAPSSLSIASGRPSTSTNANTSHSNLLTQLRHNPTFMRRYLPLLSMAVFVFVWTLLSNSVLWNHITLALQPPPGPLHMCTVPTIQSLHASDAPLDINYACSGSDYETFTTALHAFAEDVTVHDRTWGRRAAALPADTTLLALGNADTVQIIHAMACQYSASYEQVTETVQVLHFEQPNATIVLLTDAGDSLRNVTATPDAFATAIQQQTHRPLETYHAMIWGLLHNCGAVAAACPNTTQGLYFAAAQIFTGPMLFIGMMADARSEQSLAMRDAIRNTKTIKGPRKLWFISGRRYISQIHLEGSTIYGDAADNAPKTGKLGHRCTGSAGGHADLLAFDVTEFVYTHLTV